MSRLDRVIAAIDKLNAEDPNLENDGATAVPKELLYARRMSEQLQRFDPDAPEVLKIAARAQHIQRWKVPRNQYAEGRIGYLQWRTNLGRMHAELTTGLMAEAGYDEESREQVRQLLTKRGIKTNEQVQTLEDVICLVFLHYYFADFAAKHEEEKILDIVRKTWKKMSDRGQAAALRLPLDDSSLQLVKKALS